MAIRSDPTKDVEDSNTPELDPAELVHEARKAIKRMRALARLLRDELGEQEFRRVNGSLRAAGQRLAGARDAEVRLATLHSLLERHPKALAREGIRRLQERLAAEREQAIEPSGHEQAIEPSDRKQAIEPSDRKQAIGPSDHEQAIEPSDRKQAIEPSNHEQVLVDIAEMRAQLARWNLADHNFSTLAPGLERIYREGRRRAKRVKRRGARDAQDLHDWRKRVKSLYYALDMLGAKKTKARGPARRANRLGELLGEDHDLWMLSLYVEEHRDAFAGEAAGERELLRRIERRRKRLRKRALKIGRRLYRHKPASFTRRIGRSLPG
jgi:CHAD domain-containing protein